MSPCCYSAVVLKEIVKNSKKRILTDTCTVQCGKKLFEMEGMLRVIIGAVIGAAIGSVIGYFGKCSSGICPLTSNPYSGALYGAILGLLFALMKQ